MRLARGVRVNTTVVTGFVAQAMQYGAALFLLPVLFTRLDAQEIGIWYLFIAVQGLVLIADFGFQHTFARNIALAHSGAQDLLAQGISDQSAGETNWPLLGEVLSVARRVYFGLAAILLVLLLTGGTLYIRMIAARGGLDVDYITLSWAVFCTGVCLAIYFQWISPLLIGTDRVRANYIFLIIARGGFAVLGIICLLLGGGLLSLACALVAADLLGRLSVYPAVRRTLQRVRQTVQRPDAFRQVFARIWPNGMRQGVVGIASFLILRYSAFVVVTFYGLEAMGSYGVTLQLVTALQQVALLPITIMLPQLVAAQVRRDRADLRRRWYQSMAAYGLLFVAGALGLLFVGPHLISFLDANVTLLPFTLLATLLVVMALEGNHAIAASIIMSGNRVPFVIPAIASGVAVAILATGAAAVGLGLLAVIVAQGLVQLAYNNWRWPLMVYRDTRPPAGEAA